MSLGKWKRYECVTSKNGRFFFAHMLFAHLSFAHIEFAHILVAHIVTCAHQLAIAHK